MDMIDKTAQIEKVAHTDNGKSEKVAPPVKNLPPSQIYVSSEIGQLQRLIVHSPDAGIGKLFPENLKIGSMMTSWILTKCGQNITNTCKFSYGF